MSAERDSHIVVFALSDRIAPTLAAIYRSFGYSATAAPTPSATSLQLGKRDCSGKECIAYQQIWGSFRQHLEQTPARGRTVLLQVGGDGSCRNCSFPVKDDLSLAHHKLDRNVGVRVSRPDASVHPTFGARFWAAGVTYSILHQLAAYHRGIVRSSSAIDELYAGYCARLESVCERPAGSGLTAYIGTAARLRDLERLVDDACAGFAGLPRDARSEDTCTALLSGNVYVRIDEASNDDLVRRLSAYGVRVVVEPLTLLAEYFAMEGSSDLLGLPTDAVGSTLYSVGMAAIRRRLYERARALHPWIPMPDPRAVIEASREVLGRFPRGEAPITIASVLHADRSGAFDGVILASPWGCGPALVSESVLRRRVTAPLLVIYSDGSPLDERRLAAFAYRLRARRARGAEHAVRADRGAAI